MTRRKSIVGALMLCALSLCAFGAANAFAAEGITAVVCTTAPGGAGTGEYKTAHCETPKEKGDFETVQIAAGTATPVTQTAEGTSILSATISLVKVNVTCSAMMSLAGNVKNVEVSGKMQAHGTGIELNYTGCHASPNGNAAAKCDIENQIGNNNKGTVLTNKLTGTTGFTKSPEPEEHFVTVEPEEEEGGVKKPFAKFKLIQTAGATCPAALVGVLVTVTGSAKGALSTTKHSDVTFSGTVGGKLKVGSATAEYSGTNHGVMEGTDETVGAETFAS